MIKLFMKHKHKILSVAALLLIALVAIGVTFSWIEGGASFTISNENTDVKTAAFGDNKSKIYDGLLMDPGTLSVDANGHDNTTATTVDITKFDKVTNSSELFFSPVSSNGESFYFPTNASATHYRPYTTNDIGTNFIKFSFKAKATKACFLTLEEKPAFTIIKNGVTVQNSSAFRVMIHDSLNSKKTIMTTAEDTTNINNTYVTNDSGSPTNTYVIRKASDFVYNKTTFDAPSSNHLADYTSAQANTETTITVAVWLDGIDADASLIGSSVDVSIKLRIGQETVAVTYTPRTYESDGTTLKNAQGGSIAINGGTSFNTEKVIRYVKGTTVSGIAATPATGYDFVNWIYGNTTTITNPIQLSTINADTTVYANFKLKKYLVTATSVLTPDLGTQSTVGGTVKVSTASGNGTGQATGYADHGGSITFTATVADASHIFRGWYNGTAANSTQLGTNTSYTVSNVTGARTIYARFANASNKVTANVYYSTNGSSYTLSDNNSNGGVVYFNNEDEIAGVQNQIDVNADASVTLHQAAASGYQFVGWYNTSNQLITNTASYQFTPEVDTEVRARFVKTYTLTFYSQYRKLDSDSYSNATTGGYLYTTYGGTTYSNNSSNPASITVPAGTSITLNKSVTAAGTYEYEFDSWSSGNGTYTMTSNQTIYGKFSMKTKYVYFGVIKYIIDGNKIAWSDLRLRYWGDGFSDTFTSITNNCDTANYSLGSDYWNNSQQEFYVFRGEVPSTTTGMKPYKYANNQETWYGSDITLSSTVNTVVLFEYSDTYYTQGKKY